MGEGGTVWFTIDNWCILAGEAPGMLPEGGHILDDILEAPVKSPVLSNEGNRGEGVTTSPSKPKFVVAYDTLSLASRFFFGNIPLNLTFGEDLT